MSDVVEPGSWVSWEVGICLGSKLVFLEVGGFFGGAYIEVLVEQGKPCD